LQKSEKKNKNYTNRKICEMSRIMKKFSKFFILILLLLLKDNLLKSEIIVNVYLFSFVPYNLFRETLISLIKRITEGIRDEEQSNKKRLDFERVLVLRSYELSAFPGRNSNLEKKNKINIVFIKFYN